MKKHAKKVNPYPVIVDFGLNTQYSETPVSAYVNCLPACASTFRLTRSIISLFSRGDASLLSESKFFPFYQKRKMVEKGTEIWLKID